MDDRRSEASMGHTAEELSLHSMAPEVFHGNVCCCAHITSMQAMVPDVLNRKG